MSEAIVHGRIVFPERKEAPVSFPVKETEAKENFWFHVRPDSGRAASPPTTHGAALRYNSATIRR